MGVKIKLLGVLFFGFLLLSFSLYSAFVGKYLQSSSVLLATFLILWVVLFGLDSLRERWYLASIPAALVVLSIFNAFLSSPLSNPDSYKENSSLVSRAISTDSCSPEVQPDELRREAFNKLREVLVKKCALQSYVDVRNVAVDLTKAIYLDPVTSTLDSIYSEFKGKREVTCGEIAAQLDSLCPGFTN